MEQVKELLNQIKEIVIKDKAIYEERRLRGEKFNIFKILELSRNETRLHSAFMASLLNKDGDHGLKDAFLNSFLYKTFPDYIFDSMHSQVFVEYPIGKKNEEETEGGRIDILVKDCNGNAVIIENKIDANDQPNQLLRYYNYAKNNFKTFKLVYLTPNGINPSELSTGENKIDYITLSYSEDIIDWMEENIKISSRTPLVRETIFQYIINLKEILFIMDNNNRDKLIEVATSTEYIESSLAFMENEDKIKASIREHFISDLKKLADRKGLIFECDEEIIDLLDNQWIRFSLPKSKGTWSIFIGWGKHNSRDGAQYGISRFTDETTSKLAQNTIESLPQIWRNKHNEEYPFGWDFFWSKNGKKNSGRWWDWNDVNTLRAMINGDLLYFIETQIIDITIEKNLLNRINKLTK